MHEMKGDMGGAAAVLGAMYAICAAELPRRVVGLLACAENMPDGLAVRPGDIVSTLDGKTVEILNTDAEGRLVLCDTLAYAQKYYAPLVLVDIATLTGACVIALGDHSAGLFTHDKKMADRFIAQAEQVGERFWPMPLWESYKEALKSESADIANIGAREGGAIYGALFLEAFVKPGTPWIHLDIAGPSYLSKKTALSPVGGTGFGVRSLFEFVRNF
jgi:leucyl aminopeptidase